ncbi:MAG: T9SS type B sorting domain-containing protein [Cytophagales bacterium]|nr:T9SS type B sorting domain-containing protein [Cytophagales bacterium]
MSGYSIVDQPGVYGIQGVPSPANKPGARMVFAHWKDLSGNFWLFGGGGYDEFGAIGGLNDLWKYDLTSNVWTWINGNNFVSGSGIYGAKCVASVSNIPRVRNETRACWTDACGNFWLFGGFRFVGINYNDLWHYNHLTNEWLWVSGDSIYNQPGVYGTQGASSPSNKPGARSGTVSWMDNSGNLWLFGGYGSPNFYNDLWKYVPDPNCAGASPLVAAASPDTSICLGDSVQLNASGGINYNWNPSTGLSDSTVSNPLASPDTTTTYFVTVSTDICSAMDSITINVYSDPIISISGDTGICEGDNTTLTASGGTAYLWNTGDTTASITVNPTDTTNYKVTVFNGSCFATDSIMVAVQTSSLNIVNIEICTGDSTFAGGSYQTTSGTYFDTLNVSGECDSVLITQLNVNSLPQVDAGTNITINADSCVALSASAGVIYIWTPPIGLSCTDCQNPLGCPGQTTTYYLTIIDANGCIGNDDVTITVTPKQVIPCSEKIFVPDIFSPNHDGQNDVLQVIGKGFNVVIFMIYNRWGERVFITENKSYGWDGTYKGEMMSPAVFVYYLEVTCTDTGEKFTTKGDITLVR